MKRAALLLALVVAQFTFAQAPNRLKKGNRPVFMSAQVLAMHCQHWAKVFYPHGHPLRNDETVMVSPEEQIHAFSCASYILGVQDSRMEASFSSHYRPVPSYLEYMKPLIDTILKYVKDHPEQQDFAGSTVVQGAEKIVIKAQTP